MAINLRGFTQEKVAFRWNYYLTNLGRVVLVREAFEDCYRVRPQDIGRFGAMDYTQMFDELAGTGNSWEILQEIHNRLVGERRHGGKKPSPYTESLLVFVPPD